MSRKQMIHLFLAICLIIGYILGFGVVYLSLIVGAIGILPTLIGSFFVWAFILYTGLLYLEAVFAYPQGANLPTIAKKSFGPIGSTLSCIIFILLNYSYLTFDFMIGPPILIEVVKSYFGIVLPFYQAYLFVLIIIGGALFIGLRFCAIINGLFTCGLFISLIFLYIQGEVDPGKNVFLFQSWIFLFVGISGLYDLLFFHSIIPAIVTYLKRNWVKAKVALWIGTIVPLLLFWSWIWFIRTSSTDIKFIQAFENYRPFGENLSIFQSSYGGGEWIVLVLFFSFAAAVFSVGVTFFHFYSDLFGVDLFKRARLKKAGICLLTILPPAALALMPPETVRKIISLTTGFGEVLLGAVIPLLCIWSMRYARKMSYPNQILGNKPLIVVLSAITLFFLYIEGIATLNLIVW